MSADWGSYSDYWGGGDDNWDQYNEYQPVAQPVAPVQPVQAPPQQNYSNFDQYNEYQPPQALPQQDYSNFDQYNEYQPTGPVAPETSARDFSNRDLMGPGRDLMGPGEMGPGRELMGTPEMGPGRELMGTPENTGVQFDDEGNPLPVGTNGQGQIVDSRGNVLKTGQGGTPYQYKFPTQSGGQPNQPNQSGGSFLDSISKFFGGGKNNQTGSGSNSGGGSSAMDWLLPLLGGAAAAYAIPKLTGTGTGSNQTFTPPNYADQFKNFTPPNFTPLPAVQVGQNAGMQMQAPQFNTLKNMQMNNPGAQIMASGPVAPRG